MVQIGHSSLSVAPLSLGANPFGWTADEQTSHDILDAFVAGGGNFVDTADVYSAWVDGNKGGESEAIIGQWFERSGRRDDIVVATKVAQHPEFPGLAPDNIKAAAEASLKRLKTDHIDLYYAHQEDPDTPIAESVAAFAELQKEGKIRAVGLSNFSAESIRAWVGAADEQGVDRPAALQPHYNLVHRSDFESKLRETAGAFDLGVMPYWALASGFLTGKYTSAESITGPRAGMVNSYVNDQAFTVLDAVRDIASAHGVEPSTVALVWLAAQPTITAPIASARTVDQLGPILAALTLELSADEVKTLTDLSAGL